MDTSNWGYTGEYYCPICDTKFLVKNDNESDPNFCPFCANRNIEEIDNEE